MQRWTAEYGTLWVMETADDLPPPCAARVAVAFAEVTDGDLPELAAAMNLSDLDPVRQRLQSGRRCFCLRADGRLAAYGWVTHGEEHVGELERTFNLFDEEAYVWDCGTVPAWRGKRLYSALLSHIIYRLHDEGVPRIWIGASRLNRPSVQGIANAGFQQVVDIAYRRVFRLSLLWFHQALSPEKPLIAAGYRVLLNDHERRVGRLAIGITP